MALIDRCVFNASSGGTGTFTVLTAVQGYQTPASAGAVNGATYSYAAQSADLTQWEIGTGVYTSSGTTLTRPNVTANSIGGTSPINFANPPQVLITALTTNLTTLSGGALASSTLILESTEGAGTTDVILVKTGSQIEAMRVGSPAGGLATGAINVGNQAGQIQSLISTTPQFQVSNAAGKQQFDARAYSNDTGYPWITFVKSRGTTVGSNVAVQSNDGLMAIICGGYDATGTPAQQQSAGIFGFCDAAPTAGSVAGRLSFQTCASGSNTLNEIMRIDSQKRVTLGGANQLNTAFEIDGAVTPLTTIAVVSWAINTGLAAQFDFAASRSGIVGTQTAVQSGDFLGEFNFLGTDGTNFQTSAQVAAVVDGSVSSNTVPMRLIFRTSTTNSVTEQMRIDSAGKVSFWVSFGYGLSGNGTGGTVTQLTSRTTSVTLNKICGQITLFAAAPVVGTPNTFTVNNTTVLATDVVVACMATATDVYEVEVTAIAANSFNLTVTSLSGVTSDSPVINFAVIKSVAS